MDERDLEEFETKLSHWLDLGYRVLADDVDGELRLTVLYVPSEGSAGSERAQEFWPMTAEVVQLLERSGVGVSHALAGPRSWPGPHPDDLDDMVS
jgi:hypothetical protein